MEAEYKRTNNFVMNTGHSLLEEGKDITKCIKKLCPYYYVLHPVMADCASTKPIASFESEGISAFPNTPSNESFLTNNIDKSDGADYVDDEEASEEVVKDADEQAPKQQKKKRPLSLAETSKKAVKVHPATELLSSLCSAMEEAASGKMQLRKEELAEKKNG
jgi:hypothetical protein